MKLSVILYNFFRFSTLASISLVLGASSTRAAEIEFATRDGQRFYRTQLSPIDRSPSEVAALRALAVSGAGAELAGVLAQFSAPRGELAVGNVRVTESAVKAAEPLRFAPPPKTTIKKQVLDHFERITADRPVFRTEEEEVPSLQAE